MSLEHIEAQVLGATDPQFSPDEQLASWTRQFQESGRPLTVDFRALAPFRSGEDRATHLLHSYPAKLLLNIPYFFLQCASLCPSGGRVLDPFCGSGTVLVEARLRGFEADGADSNPLARLLSTAKTTPVEPRVLREGLGRILEALPDAADPPVGIVNIDHWFLPEAQKALARLRSAITALEDESIRQFFWVSFSACVRRSSLADPRLSVPVRVNPERRAVYGAKGEAVIRRFENLASLDVIQLFRAVSLLNIERVSAYVEAAGSHRPTSLFSDSRSIDRRDGYYDLVITSPPYLGAQKYVRASGLSLGWLGLTPNATLRPLERLSIGREHLDQSEKEISASGIPEADVLISEIADKNPLRASIASTYLQEMKAALREAARVTRPGGNLVLVIGSNLISGVHFPTPQFICRLAQEAGFSLQLHLTDTIRSRGLMTKRNKTAGLISQESIFIMSRSSCQTTLETM